MEPKTALADRLWSEPGEVLRASGVEGEHLVARGRVLVVAVLLAALGIRLVIEPEDSGLIWGLGVAGIAAVEAIAILAWLRYRRYQAWLGFTSSIVDVLLVSAALGTLALFRGAGVETAYALLLIVVIASSLRCDVRIVTTTGAVALVAFAVVGGGLGVDLAGLDPLVGLALLAAASLLALAVVARFDRMLFLNTHDAVTNAASRSFFLKQYEREFSRAEREERKLTTVHVEVDDFHRILSDYGYRVGDTVLAFVAHKLQEGMRRHDVACRWDESVFVLMFPGASKRTVVTRMEALRDSILKGSNKLDVHANLQVTISAGIAAYPEDVSRQDDLLQMSDDRMLDAREGGQDMVVYGEMASTTETGTEVVK